MRIDDFDWYKCFRQDQMGRHDRTYGECHRLTL